MKTTKKFIFGLPKNFDDEELDFTIKRRFNHCYIIGTTGTGKTSLMERMAYDDISQGRSTIFLDVKGTHAKRLYSLAPDKSKVRFVSINHEIALNPLKKNYPIDVIVDEFIQILDILVSSNSSNPETTVRMKEYIAGSIPFFPENQRDIAHLFKFLSKKSFRQEIKHYITNENIIQCWENYDHKDGVRLRETGESICSRLALLLFSEEFRPFVLGENDFNVQEYADNGISLLVDASGFSDYKRIFLTNLIVFSIYSYISKGTHNNPLFLYVDEFQTCLSPSFTKLLERSRSAKVGFTLAHQSFSSIPDINIMKSVISIPDNMIVFRCGHYEAEVMSKIMGIGYKDIINMDNYGAYVKIGNKTIFYEIIKKPIKVESLIEAPAFKIKNDANTVKTTRVNEVESRAKDKDFISGEWLDIM